MPIFSQNRRNASLLGALAFAVAMALVPAPAAAQGPVPDDPVVQQIDIGAQWYRARCQECHEKGDLTNADFQMKWSGQSAYDLYDIIQRTMPEDEPGMLTRGTYTAIVAYLMRLNGMPAGTTVLSSDTTALRAVKLSFTRASASIPPR